MACVKLTFDEEIRCRYCDATGLRQAYQGDNRLMALCPECGGTGRIHKKFTYTLFDGRLPVKGCKSVLEVNPSGALEERLFNDIESFGGMPYEEWAKGKPFPPKSEMRLHMCPAAWAQCTGKKRVPFWCITSADAYRSCDQWGERDTCWDRYDAWQDIQSHVTAESGGDK